ncbi:hypothetical protein GCM10020331_032960 [Ectobacillus funiculus]
MIRFHDQPSITNYIELFTSYLRLGQALDFFRRRILRGHIWLRTRSIISVKRKATKGMLLNIIIPSCIMEEIDKKKEGMMMQNLDPTLKMLKELTDANGVAGNEREVREVMKNIHSTLCG